MEAVANSVRELWQAQDWKSISQKSLFDDRQLADFRLGDTQQQYGGIDKRFWK